MGSQSYFLLLLLVPAALSQGTCTTDHCVKDCTGCDPGELIADPDNCHRYYVCDGTGDIEFPEPLYCENGEVFDIDQRACDANAVCEPCKRECHYDCSLSPNSKISYFYDCNSFFECDPTTSMPGSVQSCPVNQPFFDGIDCQDDQTKCCHCHPYCSAGDVGLLISDPTDCRNYYACHKTGIPSGQGHCAPGEVFEDGKCSPYVACHTICKNVIGLDGCVDPFTCVSVGYFPKCPLKCSPEYYHCAKVSEEYVEAEKCPVGYVFHPGVHVCVLPEDCQA